MLTSRNESCTLPKKPIALTENAAKLFAVSSATGHYARSAPNTSLNIRRNALPLAFRAGRSTWRVGLLRRLLKKYGQWTRIAHDVRMLPETPKPARILSAQEKSKLLDTAKGKPEWQVAYLVALIALNTTMRGGEIRGLQWKDVNFVGETVTVRRQTTKTDAGARVIPLNKASIKAFQALKKRAELIGSSDLPHYVFPTCEHGTSMRYDR